MTQVRTTIVIDDFLATRVRQMFNGNLSLGITEIIQTHLKEQDPLKRAYGSLKGWKIDSQKTKNELRDAWGA
ncbi:MAG: hypothetical protein V1722_03960 [Candidatus Micrarchaeota archaeon]